MALAEEISRQLSIDCVPCLLVATLTQIYNEKEQAEQGKMQNVLFEKKRSRRMCNGANASAQGDKTV